MNIARLKSTAACGVLAFSMVFTGCGGGDDGPPPQTPNPPNNPAPTAPTSLAGRSYDLQASGAPATAITFNTADNYTFLDENGSILSGTYSGSRSGNSWTLTLQGGQVPQALNMAFGTGTSGSF